MSELTMKIKYNTSLKVTMQGLNFMAHPLYIHTMKIKGQGHKLYMDNLFTSFARYNDLNKKKETAVGL
jgi:hypothetical protein